METRLVTGVVRLSYPHLFVPQASQQGGEPKYSATLLIPKTDTQTVTAMNAAHANAITAAKGPGGVWGQFAPPQPKTVIYDGDGVRPNGMPFGEEAKGHWVVSTSSKRKPQIIDYSGQEVTDPNKIYAGCYVRVSINFYAYDSKGSKGIACGLNNVLFHGDGEPLGSSTTAADDFAGIIQAQQAQVAQQFGQTAPAQPNGFTAAQAAVQQAYAAPTQQAPVAQQGQPAYGQQPWNAPTQFDPNAQPK